MASRRNARRGAKSNLWKGGIASERNVLGNSVMWKDWRAAVFARDGFKCKKCEGNQGKLNPHHIYNFAQHKELRFVVENGITLCVDCHRLFHKIYGKKDNNESQIGVFLSCETG